MAGRPRLLGLLVLLGAGWGLTLPLAKIAVAGGYRAWGILFWQQVIVAAVLLAVLVGRGALPRSTPRRLGFFALIAGLGTLLPNGASLTAAIHLPAGVMSIVISMVPILAWPVAMALGQDRFGPGRAAGLALGLAGVALLVLPRGSLPDPAMVAFVPLALVAPLCYAFEGNLIARFGTAGLDPVQLLFGASLIGAAAVLPLAAASGTFIDPRPPWGTADAAVLLSSVIHAVVYATYFWTVRRAGSVFAAQVAYLVTGFGVLWSILLLAEVYSGWVWAAMALILVGMALVQPRAAA